jgi:hypothetical protein
LGRVISVEAEQITQPGIFWVKHFIFRLSWGS